MADQLTSALSALASFDANAAPLVNTDATTLRNNDLVPIHDASASTLKHVTLANLMKWGGRGVNILEFQSAYTIDPTGTNDSAAGIQAAINFVGTNSGGSGCQGVLYFPAGTYKCNSMIYMRANVILVGEGGYFRSQLAFTNAGSTPCIDFDGSNTTYNTSGAADGYIFGSGFRDLGIVTTNSTTSSTSLIRIKRCYSLMFDRVHFYDDSASHSAKYNVLMEGNINDTQFDRWVSRGSAEPAAHFYISPDSAGANKIQFNNCDIETGGKGIWITSANPAIVNINNLYAESCSASIYDDNTNAASLVTVNGGYMGGFQANDYGIYVSTDNLIATGVNFTGGGTVYTLWNGAASRCKNVHLIGCQKGNTAGAYDPNNWITTNGNLAVQQGVWTQRIANKKTNQTNGATIELFRITPTYQTGSSPIQTPLYCRVKVLAGMHDGSYAVEAREYTFVCQYDNGTATHLSTTGVLTDAQYLENTTPGAVGDLDVAPQLQNGNWTMALDVVTDVTTGGYVKFSITATVGGAQYTNQKPSVWATLEVMGDDTNSGSKVTAS